MSIGWAAVQTKLLAKVKERNEQDEDLVEGTRAVILGEMLRITRGLLSYLAPAYVGRRRL
jgi:hypothetical protein